MLWWLFQQIEIAELQRLGEFLYISDKARYYRSKFVQVYQLDSGFLLYTLSSNLVEQLLEIFKKLYRANSIGLLCT